MNILILGAGGIVSKYLVKHCPAHVRLSLAYGSRRPQMPAGSPIVRVQSVVLEDPLSLRRLLVRAQPDVIINAAGMNSVDEAEMQPERCHAINVGVVDSLLALAAPASRLVQLSTNAVYGDGASAPFRPTDPRRPANVYGMAKRDAEDLVASAGAERHLVVRLSPLYGWSPASARQNPLPWIDSTLAAGQRIRLCDDILDSPLAADVAAAIIWRLICAEATGTYNIGGRETVSRYGLGLAIASVFDRDAGLIEPVPFSAFPQLAARARDTSLDDDRLRIEFGYLPESLMEGLRRMRDEPVPAAATSDPVRASQ